MPQTILPQQRHLDQEAGWRAVLHFFEGEQFAHRLDERWSAQTGGVDDTTSVERWNELQAMYEREVGVSFCI